MLQRTNSAAETYGAMAFSPDSQRLAVAGTEQIIWVWDVTSGEFVMVAVDAQLRPEPILWRDEDLGKEQEKPS